MTQSLIDAAPTPHQRSWLRRPHTLRLRLLIATISLLTLTCAVIAFVTTLFLRSYLIGQVDDELRGAVDRTSRIIGEEPGGQPGGPPTQSIPGQGAGTFVAVVDGDEVGAAAVGEYGTAEVVTLAHPEAVIELTVGPPESVDLGKIGDYRVQAIDTSFGKLVVGLSLERTQKTIGRLVAVEVGVAGLGLAGAAAAGFLIIGRNLRPLRRLAGTAQRVSQQPLDRGEVKTLERVDGQDADPRTEVGKVGSAFNEMIGHVERSLEARQESETRVRHFVADASHELRTPLAAIRGYAELTRRSPQAVPADVAHALSRVESESARMTGLVEDLLLLARLDSGRPLSQDPVDLSALIVDAVSDAHATAPEHRWSLDLPEESVTVHGDRARLHQVVANLLANARTHTPPRTDVQVSLVRSDDGNRAVVRVHDNGPGIPVELQPAVFERFARGDSSRARKTGSTGLGLAIVAAVCASHGGSVQVDSVPGSTTFTVALPLRSETWSPRSET